MGFEFSDRSKDLQLRISKFLDDHVYPAEEIYANADLISPFSKGLSHLSCCSSLAYLAKTSIFPVSGAEQLNISEAIPDLPIISAKGA